MIRSLWRVLLERHTPSWLTVKRSGLMLVACGSCLGCAARPDGGGKGSAGKPTSSVPSDSGVVAKFPLQRIYTTAESSNTEKLRLVIRDQESWISLWAKIAPRSSPSVAPPAVDFSRQMLLVVAEGILPTGWPATWIDSVVQEHGSQLTVKIVRKQLGVGCGTTGAEVRPVEVLLVPWRADSVHFTERDSVPSPCVVR